MSRDYDMINILLNFFFLFIDCLANKLANRLGQSKSSLLSHYLSSDFVYVAITIIKKEGNKWVRKESNLRVTKANC